MTNYKRTKLSTVRKLSKPTFVNTRALNSPCYSHYKKKKNSAKGLSSKKKPIVYAASLDHQILPKKQTNYLLELPFTGTIMLSMNKI